MVHGGSDNEALIHYTRSTTIDLKGLCAGHRFAFIS
jgi:non-ribosomal peptide synthetase component F